MWSCSEGLISADMNPFVNEAHFLQLGQGWGWFFLNAKIGTNIEKGRLDGGGALMRRTQPELMQLFNFIEDSVLKLSWSGEKIKCKPLNPFNPTLQTKANSFSPFLFFTNYIYLFCKETLSQVTFSSIVKAPRGQVDGGHIHHFYESCYTDISQIPCFSVLHTWRLLSVNQYSLISIAHVL